MIVQPDTFDMHLKEVQQHFDVVSLSEWVQANQNGEPVPKKACAITFDDGWLDNYEYALPVLKAHGLPATLFGVAEQMGTDFQFWPNIVAGLLHGGVGAELARHRVFWDAISGQSRECNREAIAVTLLR